MEYKPYTKHANSNWLKCHAHTRTQKPVKNLKTTKASYLTG